MRMAFFVPDLNIVSVGVVVLLNVDVNGEMGIDVSHLVLVSSGHTSDEILDDRLDGSESCDILSWSVVDFDLNGILALLVLWESESNSDVGEILDEFAYCRIVNSALH